MRVRFAADDEVDTFLELTRMNQEEVRPEYHFDPAAIREAFSTYLDRCDPVIWFAEDAGRVVGYLMTSVGRFRFSYGQFLIQEAIYVRPEFRGTRAAVQLMKQLLAHAKNGGFPEIYGGNDFGFQPERTKRFFERFGFEVVGYQMRRRV